MLPQMLRCMKGENTGERCGGPKTLEGCPSLSTELGGVRGGVYSVGLSAN
jgi:hypothetical protein